MSPQSIVLLSGGLDSVANLALCVKKNLNPLALHFNYGQRAFESERSAVEAICQDFQVPLKIIELPWMSDFTGNALTSQEVDLPSIQSNELDDLKKTQSSAQNVWVPNRNGVFINIAAAVAESLKINSVYVGFNREEAATFPDNSEDYISAVNQALHFSTANGVTVQSHTSALDKSEIVRLLKTEFPKFSFRSLWSCYRSGEVLCGKCESCLRFFRALEAQGVSL